MNHTLFTSHQYTESYSSKNIRDFFNDNDDDNFDDDYDGDEDDDDDDDDGDDDDVDDDDDEGGDTPNGLWVQCWPTGSSQSQEAGRSRNPDGGQ